MTSIRDWRKFVTYATVDILLITAAGSAMAAPVTHAATAATSVWPAVALLGVGLCGLPSRRRTGD
ncbi:MAG TPA: hypothetical protein VMU81_10405 [Acetobacteraceae bacterium]|jgi:hypothetical protein|nr:hypothetical protein [Acetobacteraceae bacterium]